MDRLSLAAALLLILTPCAAAQADTAAAPPLIEQWRPLIAEASQRFDVPEAWIAAVMQAESGGRTMLDGLPITSCAGAMGLMQVMPGTWEDLRRTHDLGDDPHDPHDNIMAGAAYLKAMHERFGYPGVFAAYNAGPDRYEEHLRTGRALPAETNAYIASLSRVAASPDMPPAILSGTSLFFQIGSAPERAVEAPSATPDRLPSGGLFVPLGPDRDQGE